ncbi:MAG: LEA type 2 family protein [Steroidobacteraceae bacterium]
MRPHVAQIAAVLIAALLAMTAGCSMLVPKFEPPRLSVVSIELGRSDLFAQQLKVRMRVENPNDRVLPVEGLSYTLDIAGERAASGVSSASFMVPALGEAEFDMDVTANLAGALLRLLSRGSHSDQIEYHIVGKVRLSQGLLRSVPFEQSGTFSLR